MEDQPKTSEDLPHNKTHSEILDHLFNKKYVYPNTEKWSLKSSSIFGSLMQGEGTVQHFKDNETIRVAYTQQEEDCTSNRKCAGENAYQGKESKKLKPQNSQEIVQETITQQPEECCEKVSAPLAPEKSHTVPSRDFQHPIPQIKSPRFLDGRQFPPNKYRRKTAPPAQRAFHGMKVVLPQSWQCDRLIREKDKLNSLKDRLSDKEMITWHQHTNFTNLAGKVVGEVKTHFSAELCTQAWCKFHEILASYSVVPESVLSPQSQAPLNSIHLCEAPGAFITSLNHFLVSRGVDTQQRWRWLGTTLNPYYEGNDTGRMINDDRFIRTTYDHWFFGTDNSGDLMCMENMRALMKRARAMGDIQLITADGSIDCQENPAEQEVIVSRLHHCEVLCSCLLLAPGGTLVIKLFTMFEASSITLLYFLNCAFQQVTICKPATSKSGNSEVYAVCSGYTAPLSQDALLSVFAAVCASKDAHVVLLPREDIPDDFMTAHVNCCLHFCQLQSETISRNLQLFITMTEAEQKRTVELQEQCVKYFVRRCCLQQIDNENRIRPFGYKSSYTRFSGNQELSRKASYLPYSKVPCVGSGSVSLPMNRLGGTFHQRQQQNQFPWQQQLEQMQDYVADENAGQRIKRRQKIPERVSKRWKLLYGKEFTTVASSHFVDCRLVSDLQMMMQHAQVNMQQQKNLADHSTSTLKQAVHLLRLSSSTTTTTKPHHHHHHHPYPCTPTSTQPAIYHLPLKGSVTGFWPADSPELSDLGVRRLGSVEDLTMLDGDEEEVVGVVVDLTCPHLMGREEVGRRRQLIEVVLGFCGYLQNESSVVLIMPLALTRLTAGLVYIMATLFQETSFTSSGQSVFLHQTLVFHRFSTPSYPLLTLLERLRCSFSSPFPPQPACTLHFCQKSNDKAPVPGDSRERSVWISDMSSLPDTEKKGGHRCFPDGSVSRQEGGRGMRCGERSYDKGCDCVTTDVKATCSHCAVLHCREMSDCVSRRLSGDSTTASVKKATDREKEVPDQLSEETMKCSKRGRTVSENEDVTMSDAQPGTVGGKGLATASTNCKIIDTSSALPCGENQSVSTKVQVNGVVTSSDHGNNVTTTTPPHTDVARPNDDSSSSSKSHTLNFGSMNSNCVAEHETARNNMQNSCSLSQHEVPTHCPVTDPVRSCGSVSVGEGVRSSSCDRGQQIGAGVEEEEMQWSRCEGGVPGARLKMVPLEIVPVMDLVNDMTFTRFLQASNRHSITRFLAAMKLAEQARLVSSSHQETQ